MHQTGHSPEPGPAAAPAPARPGADLVLGLDVGGTATRALLCDLAGHRHGRAVSGGGNPAAHRTHRAAAALSVALRGALAEVDPRRVGHGVVGLAGRRLLARPDVRAALRRVWQEAGLDCPMTVVPDAVAAFAAGSAAGSGSVLISGTGAIAVRMDRWEEVRRSDGLGWLLGDLGSGFWLGREAVRVTLEALAGRAHAPVLAPLVLTALLGAAGDGPDPAAQPDPGGALADRLVAAVYGGRPVELARLAPLVTAAAERDDAAAAGIVEAAAGHLLATLAAVRRPGERTPVVLSGSCLLSGGPLGRLVVRGIGRQWPGAQVCRALDGAAGAAVLAADALGLDEATLAAMHRRLLAEPD
ncbi:BadF/BadG/BcrA/BcrD ATPase family protein [Streptomyces sp. NPDC092296]|uniref:BadF/BadG/BcrA/BcrD ATPase family protein n=1 Tax=Streptomyces sp. NPDC092296 TaxID=3366012 RepID=UPI0038221710